jgi:glycosyltransferase involved in cell wall biosynthesis
VNVSLIITTYNRPDYLDKVLAGALLQRTLPQEIIVADDGSDDRTAQVVEKWRKTASRPLLHVRQQDRGFRLARIRNKAVKRAAGEYLVFLDGDCVPSPHLISDHLDLAEEGHFFQGKRMLLSKESSPLFEASRIDERGYLLRLFLKGGVSNSHHLLRIPFFPALRSRNLRGMRGCNMGFHRRDLIAVNGFNEEFVGWGREDSELAVRLYRYGLTRKTHPFRALCFHLWHEENARDRLARNDELLREALEGSGYRCRKGIEEGVAA